MKKIFKWGCKPCRVAHKASSLPTELTIAVTVRGVNISHQLHVQWSDLIFPNIQKLTIFCRVDHFFFKLLKTAFLRCFQKTMTSKLVL